MEEGSEVLQAAIFEIIENQIHDDSPREAKQALERLLTEGQNREEAMKLIGCAVAVELFEIMKHQQPFNESRYIENLKRLPQLPWEEDSGR